MADTAILIPEEAPGPSREPRATSKDDDLLFRTGRRYFTIAAVVATGVMAVPFLWVLTDLWSHSADPFRSVPSAYFYDIQARAMFHGHLSLSRAQLGIEGFVHDGRTYTYFGIFPSLLRMPILLVTSRFDGDLTPASMGLAWLMTAIFSSLLLWRLRIVTRGRAVLGRAEAASFGVLVATILGGSVWVYLAATPFVFNEDFAWSIPLTVGSLLALLGMVERPTAGRVWASGILILLANLNRTPTGYACVIGALLVALWYSFGRGGASNRRWGVPMFAVALVAFGASSLVTYAKFGTPVGLPMADQVWALVNAHRRYFLAANDGKAFSFGFLPSTVVAYLQPFGIRFSTLFPFISTPAAPAAAIGAVLDETYPTASAPATMPLLVLLAFWGTITAFRPKAIIPFRLTRIVLVTGAAATAGVLLWGYISERYLADFMPFLIVAGGVGLIDVWRRFEGRSRRARGSVLAIISVLAVYCVVANFAIAVEPAPQMTSAQIQDFVSTEDSLSISSLANSVQHGTTLPNLGSLWAALHGWQLLRPLRGVRHLRDECAGPADRSLHVDPGGTESGLHPAHLVHLQPSREVLHQASDPDDVRCLECRSQAQGHGLLSDRRYALWNIAHLAIHRLGGEAHLFAPLSVPDQGDHRPQPAPDQYHLVRDIPGYSLHRWDWSACRAPNPEADQWIIARSHRVRTACLLQHEHLPEPATRPLTVRCFHLVGPIVAGTTNCD